MAEARIPVVLRNPGQVFACLGLMEAAERILDAHCEGAFEYEGGDTQARFALWIPGDDDPVNTVVRFLAEAEVIAIAPRGSSLATEKWKVASERRADDDPRFSVPEMGTPAAMPIVLRNEGVEVPIDHWADGGGTGRDNVKFWAGSGGYPGAGLARDALTLVSALGANALADACRDPFDVAAPMSSSFRFDWRRDYIPLDVGFSLNDHSTMTPVGYPLVEILAAIGMQHARPSRISPRDKLAYRYGVSSARLPTVFARAVLGCQGLGFPIRTFRMRLGWPGQENQARCIIDAEEEFDHD
ncbi:MAG: type I-U CRISPR-associated protein Cas8c [Gammaproteobacteria bacterium]|nr:type I-U CRISPR-associated protein Cas8c [Gammaproteobacteria bacterium]